MKRFVAVLLLGATMLSLCSCSSGSAGAQSAAQPAAVETGAAQVQTTAPETQPPAVEGSLFLKVSSITFSLVGESDDIYLGVVPRELVTWESEDPSVVSVDNGVLTANGVGVTTIRATYYDQQVTCQAACLANTQEELYSLDAEVLSAPKRLPPDVDLSGPCTAFDNCAILGDSITYFLWQYESLNDYLGQMIFVSRHGISIQSLMLHFKNMYYQGHEMYLEDIVAATKAERVYIMLGCLDYQVPEAREQLMDNWILMLDRIEEKAPDTEIVIVSNIPCFTEKTEPTVFNTAVVDITAQLRALAAERGYGFLDLGYYIQDHYGRMPAIYCKDEFHINDEGNLVWVKLMRHMALFEREGGSIA